MSPHPKQHIRLYFLPLGYQRKVIVRAVVNSTQCCQQWYKHYRLQYFPFVPSRLFSWFVLISWDTLCHPQPMHQRHNSPRLKMLSGNMFLGRCIRQQCRITAVFQRHVCGITLEKAGQSEKTLRPHCIRNQLLHKSSETSHTHTAVMGPAVSARNVSARTFSHRG